MVCGHWPYSRYRKVVVVSLVGESQPSHPLFGLALKGPVVLSADIASMNQAFVKTGLLGRDTMDEIRLEDLQVSKASNRPGSLLRVALADGEIEIQRIKDRAPKRRCQVNGDGILGGTERRNCLGDDLESQEVKLVRHGFVVAADALKVSSKQSLPVGLT